MTRMTIAETDREKQTAQAHSNLGGTCDSASSHLHVFSKVCVFSVIQSMSKGKKRVGSSKPFQK